MNATGQKPTQPDESDKQADREPRRDAERTLNERPADPNRAGAKVRIPPGVEPDDLWDSGSQTPGAPPVDNRS